MPRFAASIEYCGLHYSGWQQQDNANSVQQTLQQAISKVADHPVTVIASGRTDRGVHSIGQIVHFDSASDRQEYQWIRGVNTYLPNDISICWVKQVKEDFHARFSTLQRSYRYVIMNRNVSPSYLHGRVTWHWADLKLEPMQRACALLLGKHDFSAFRAAGCQSKNPVKEIRSITINQSGQWFWLDISADGFLYNMVRNIIGVLMPIGEELKSAGWAQQVLHSKDRTLGGMTAPPDGLYFVNAQYDAKYNLPQISEPCRFW